MVRKQGRQPTEVAKELGICIDTLRSWLKASGIQMGQASRLSREQQRNQALRRRLVALHEKYPAMGLDSLYHLLKPEFGCSRKRVHRQMWLAGVSSARRRACKAATNSNHSHPIAPNLLMRGFTFQRPDQAWVGDITYINTHQRRLDLSGNRKRPVYQEDCGVRILRALKQALRADRHAAGACGPGNGIPPPQASKRAYLPQ